MGFISLEDAVEFQTFYFRKNTTNIELTIKEVYKGEKWDDTCVTALIPNKVYSFDGEDKTKQFEQTYTYKCDKNKVTEKIEKIKKNYKPIERNTDK